ncbi:MAG TPA: hypothetical protein VGC13_14930 [Longimicrobium sp.]|jgi:predicted DNA-binding transcriptional regulator AlpA|uniref:hypothetical protein n=1 Tax=Longimicrobium sp. TaxID=2029185 RepID=UPI002EDAADF6
MDHRSIPVHTLREFARDRAELSSVRQVAAEVGLGRTTLHNFISADTTPHPRVRRLLALWYLREKEIEESRVADEGYSAALDILLAGIPEAERASARAELLERIAALHAAFGAGAPPWLHDLRPPEPEA